jgi:hypothetical protein
MRSQSANLCQRYFTLSKNTAAIYTRILLLKVKGTWFLSLIHLNVMLWHARIFIKQASFFNAHLDSSRMIFWISFSLEDKS